MNLRLFFIPLLLLAVGAATTPTTPTTNKLTLTGTLTRFATPIGETIPLVGLSSGGTSYELEFKDDALLKKADELNGKSVTVTGTLTIKQGTAKGQRLIITVDSLVPAAATTKP